ncbi:HEAT repeat domain-containing protein [Nocardia sp. NPDC051833]|uniref:HEAT repeat domain-containing protein n=1 Tax=Nocardia sp. NPDC051833 TaxID=3155674 RepID=UPI0034289CE3
MDRDQALARIQASDWDVRRDAVVALGRWLPAEDAFAALVAALNDADTAVQQDAAEQLVRFGRGAGLEAVLADFGRRSDDPDVDYIEYRLRELQLLEQVPLVKSARALGSGLSADALAGLEQFEELLDES